MKTIACLTAAMCALAPASRAVGEDARIESAAEKSWVFQHELKDDDIDVDAKDGVVTLTGTVAEEHHRALAKDTVEGLPGVKRVEDRLEVKGEQPARYSDAWIGTKVKSSLAFHANVSGAGTDVDVKDGVVTLRGEAETQAEKDLATEYARDVDGVRDVRNAMTIGGRARKGSRSAGDKLDDASITARVKSALLFHRSTSALRTSVRTADGIVELGGTAGSEAEKALAERVAGEVSGVRGVRNRVEVKSP